MVLLEPRGEQNIRRKAVRQDWLSLEKQNNGYGQTGQNTRKCPRLMKGGTNDDCVPVVAC